MCTHPGHLQSGDGGGHNVHALAPICRWQPGAAGVKCTVWRPASHGEVESAGLQPVPPSQVCTLGQAPPCLCQSVPWEPSDSLRDPATYLSSATWEACGQARRPP